MTAPNGTPKAGEAARALPQEERIADAARRDRADLGAEIEPFVKRFGHLAAGGLGRAAVARGKLGIARPGARSAATPRRRSHDWGQKPRAEPEFAIERNMRGDLQEDAQARVADAPIVELAADGFD